MSILDPPPDRRPGDILARMERADKRIEKLTWIMGGLTLVNTIFVALAAFSVI